MEFADNENNNAKINLDPTIISDNQVMQVYRTMDGEIDDQFRSILNELLIVDHDYSTIPN